MSIICAKRTTYELSGTKKKNKQVYEWKPAKKTEVKIIGSVFSKPREINVTCIL